MSNAIVPAKQRLDTLRSMFEKSKGAIAEIVPRHLPPEKIARIVLSAASRTPELLNCTAQSIFLSAIQSAQLGLEPCTPLGHAYLVPYKNKNGTVEAQFIPGYRGLIMLARNGGEVANIVSRVVYEGDTFEIEYGLNEKLVHVPMMGAGTKDRAVVAVYAVATLKGGERQFEVMDLDQLNAIRNRNGTRNGPWATDFAEMARKTVVRRLCKSLPLSTERDAAIVGALEAQRRVENDEPADYGELPDSLRDAAQLEDGAGSQTASGTVKAILAAAAGKVAAEATAQG